MADLGIGTVDPILGTYEGVVYRPVYNDFCRHYVKDVFGIKIPTDVGCQSTRCAAEGNCPAAATPGSMAPTPQQQYAPPSTQWIAGVDNNVVLIGLVVVIAFAFWYWRK